MTTGDPCADSKWPESGISQVPSIIKPPLYLPQFLGIGAQKAGTTWLHSNLRIHPRLYLPEIKELHYFDRFSERSTEWYASNFASCGLRMAGEITPAYGILAPRQISEIRRLIPYCKIILILRNPIDRAWSHALMSLVWRADRRYKDVTEIEFIKHFNRGGSRRRGDYESIIANWEAEFGDGICIKFYDEIKSHPEILLKSIFRYLGVTCDVDWNQFPIREVIYGGINVPLPERLYDVLHGMYRTKIENLESRFGEPVKQWLRPH